MSVVVLGSLNMDLVSHVPRLPRPGETLIGTGFATVCGGKGANQAVAAARMGATVRMVGCVGADAFGEQLRTVLAAEGVDTAGVAVAADARTGTAQILVAEDGANQIVVSPGANGTVGDTALRHLADVLATNDVLLLQGEVPQAANLAAATLARERGARVILDPAPAGPLPDALLRQVYLLTPNALEAEVLLGRPVPDLDAAAAAATALRARGAANMVVSLGELGGWCATPETAGAFAAFPARAVDTVAAGDAFNGALAAALAEGRTLGEALAVGAAAGALAVGRPGAMDALPKRTEVEALLAAHRPLPMG